jgi:hypothetical protein
MKRARPSMYGVALGIAVMLVVSAGVPAAAQESAPRAVTLPVSGTAARGGDFSGSVTINRFEQRDNQVVAVGLVRGTLSRGNRAVASGVIGEVVWPVTVRAGGIAAVVGQGNGASGIRRIAYAQRSEARTSGIVRAQAESCSVLEVGLGPVDVNLLGATVSLAPVALTLAGEAGTPLGDLVCAASDLLGNVAGLVNLLNSILGLLTGLLGGLTGGLGGAVPVP